MDEQRFHDWFYDTEAERIFSSRLYRELLASHVRFLREVTPEIAAARILSIGCGDGRREILVAPYAGHIVGIDLSPVAVQKARQRASGLGAANVEFHAGGTECLEGRFGPPFDAVWCAGILHHLRDEEIFALLRAAASVLKAGGRFVSMDPNARRAVNLFKPFFRRRYARHHSPGERELRPAEVIEKLRAAGFRDIEVRFTDAFISPLAWLYPRLTGPVAPLLAGLDQLLVRVPAVNQLSSGFAVLARNGG
jgi:SAM-dependent methyltransferase